MGTPIPNAANVNEQRTDIVAKRHEKRKKKIKITCRRENDCKRSKAFPLFEEAICRITARLARR